MNRSILLSVLTASMLACGQNEDPAKSKTDAPHENAQADRVLTYFTIPG